MTGVEIRGDLITLGQFLKFAGIVATGADARAILEDELVLVNEEVETRRGRKLFANDVVTALGNKYLVTLKRV